MRQDQSSDAAALLDCAGVPSGCAGPLLGEPAQHAALAAWASKPSDCGQAGRALVAGRCLLTGWCACCSVERLTLVKTPLGWLSYYYECTSLHGTGCAGSSSSSSARVGSYCPTSTRSACPRFRSFSRPLSTSCPLVVVQGHKRPLPPPHKRREAGKGHMRRGVAHAPALRRRPRAVLPNQMVTHGDATLLNPAQDIGQGGRARRR